MARWSLLSDHRATALSILNPYQILHYSLQKANTGNFLVGLIQVILNPRQGWLDAGENRYSPRDLVIKGLLPFLGIVALSALADAFYYYAISVVEAIVQGIIDFTGYFVSLFICHYFFLWAYNRWVGQGRFDNDNVATFIIYNIAAMALMTLLNNLLPGDLALLSFLPLYSIYIIWSGREFLKVPETKNPHFLAVSLLAVFLPPYVLSYCLSLFL